MGGSKVGFIFGRVCYSVENGGGDDGFGKYYGSQPKRAEPAFIIYGRGRISSFPGIRSVVVLFRVQQKDVKRAKQKVWNNRRRSAVKTLSKRQLEHVYGAQRSSTITTLYFFFFYDNDQTASCFAKFHVNMRNLVKIGRAKSGHPFAIFWGERNRSRGVGDGEFTFSDDNLMVSWTMTWRRN